MLGVAVPGALTAWLRAQLCPTGQQEFHPNPKFPWHWGMPPCTEPCGASGTARAGVKALAGDVPVTQEWEECGKCSRAAGAT